MTDDRFEIVCRDRDELIDDYLMEVTEMDRQWCEEVAIVYETLSEGDFYPAVFQPKEELLFD